METTIHSGNRENGERNRQIARGRKTTDERGDRYTQEIGFYEIKRRGCRQALPMNMYGRKFLEFPTMEI